MIYVSAALLALPSVASASEAEGGNAKVWADPMTRYVHISYQVPAGAPEEVVVWCSWSPPGKAEWRPAKVTPLLSETALRLASEEEWKQWTERGKVIERRAAGLERTVVFNPYPEAQEGGRVDVDFRVQVHAPDGKVLAEEQSRVQADNSDVVAIEDWSQVLQRDLLVTNAGGEGRKWSWRTDLEASAATFGHALYGQSAPDVPLRPLTYPLNLRGWYAIFVCTAPHWGIGLRLTGDERTDSLGSRRPGEEVFWRWAKMDRQHLVLKQPHSYAGYAAAQIDYVRLVPLSPELRQELEAPFSGPPDRIVAGYFEPYSWAFVENVLETLQHREPLVAFAQAGIQIVDLQIGRFGDKVVYESRLTDPLLYSTIGDPLDGGTVPQTDNVGRMQQYTNALEAELRYARELGMIPHANFGATNCYPGTPLEGDFSKQHPDWRRGHALRYEVPEVRQYMLSLYREALEIGAPGLSLDFCRYPEGVDTPETCNAFLRELRDLREEFSRARGQPVPLLVRFPAQGVRLWQNFDYRVWVQEGLVDYLCPSNIQGRHLHFDIAPYVEAVRGTQCKLLPVVDGLSWGLEMPGLFLWRVRQLFEAGVDGIYVYQADARALGWPADRRCLRLLGHTEAVRAWWERDRQTRPHCSKGIYLNSPSYPTEGYHSWERLRVWLEGVEMGEVEMHLEGKFVRRFTGPPYVLGSEEYESDQVIPTGEHELLIRARDGDGWLEQKFTVRGGG